MILKSFGLASTVAKRDNRRMQVSEYQKTKCNALLNQIFIVIAVIFILGSSPEIAQGVENIPLTLLQPDSTIMVISKSAEKLDFWLTLHQKTAHVDVAVYPATNQV